MLGAALVVNSTLQRLDLLNNGITSAGVASLSRGLRVNRGLTQLDLVRCKLGAGGASSLSSALRENATLTRLNLRGSDCSAADVLALAGAVRVHHMVRALDIDRREELDEAAPALRTVLEQSQLLADAWWRRRGLVCWCNTLNV